MSNILKEFESFGLINKKKTTQEAYIDPEQEQEQDGAEPEGPEDDEPRADDIGQDSEEEGMIQVPEETKEKVMELHKLAGEVYGLMAGEPETGQETEESYDAQPDDETPPEAVGDPDDTPEDDKTVDATIDELISTSWGGDNESQGKAIELLKGLAFSDDPKANAFMMKLDELTSGMDASALGESKKKA